VKSAPLTYSWLALLLVTTIIQHSIPVRRLYALLQKESTNLHHLASDPVRVLIQSLLWIDGQYWTPYLVVFTLFLAPAERWLGHLRWLLAGLVSHVGATYLSEAYLYWRIQEAVSSPRLIDARDIGVSYFVVGIVGCAHLPHSARLAMGVRRGRTIGLRRLAGRQTGLHTARPFQCAADRAGVLSAHPIAPAGGGA
jgi:hypothetical protein